MTSWQLNHSLCIHSSINRVLLSFKLLLLPTIFSEYVCISRVYDQVCQPASSDSDSWCAHDSCPTHSHVTGVAWLRAFTLWEMANLQIRLTTHCQLESQSVHLPAQYWIYILWSGFLACLFPFFSGCNQSFYATIDFHQTVYESTASKTSPQRLDIARYVICACTMDKNWPSVTGFISTFPLVNEVEHIFTCRVDIGHVDFHWFAHFKLDNLLLI